MSGDGRQRSALVTGGAGFIGHHLVAHLEADGWRVRVLDDLSSGREENLGAVDAGAELLVGDIRDAGLVERAVEGVDVVFHQAAIASVPRSVDDPIGTSSVNVDGTLNVLDAARRAGVSRVVLASSSAVYGDDPKMPKTEALPACLISPYALQKYVNERQAALYTRVYGLETVCLRYFNVYGPRQDPKSDYAAVIPLFLAAAREGRPVTIYGDGEQTRDFVFVGDVVEANRLAATSEGVAGQVFNVASGSAISVNELVARIREGTGIDVEVRHVGERTGDIRHSSADVAHIRRQLDFDASMDLGAGLGITFAAIAGGREGDRT